MKEKNGDTIGFSIVVPIYNKKPHLKRCISSVFNQTEQNFELILIEDASTDGSLEEAERLAEARTRIFTREKPGPGGYAARNLGVEKARADWIAFLDADDEWDSTHLGELQRLLRHCPQAHIAGTKWRFAGERPQRRAADDEPADSPDAPETFNLQGYWRMSARGDPPFCTSSVAVRKTTLQAAGGFPAGFCERGGDVDTWLRVMAEGECGVRSRRVTATYHRDSVNMVTRTAPFTIEQRWRTFAWLIGRETDPVKAEELRRYANKRVISAFIRAARNAGGVQDNLRGCLYDESLTRKQRLFLHLTRLPSPIWQSIYDLYTLFRKTLGGKKKGRARK